MVTGKRCFGGDIREIVREKIEKGEWGVPQNDVLISDLCRHFIESLLTIDSQKRPSAKLALFHPWLCDESNDLSIAENLTFLEKSIQQWNYLTEEVFIFIFAFLFLLLLSIFVQIFIFFLFGYYTLHKIL
ncbi:protein kinase [Reticulomyxa filosa]|uniref:Protein kinase n=1 Tax=Reticulomyxa filosa TaxID=46433 RepID=X6N386_RETFI|nr:protein kinase [Reticulomyxa filosa]|eukprot:ETO19772.1 protein kinase [Reticulomyxa filosa]